MKNIKEFFACPYCGKPLVAKESLSDHLAEYRAGRRNFCTCCGESLASAYDAALKELEAE